MRIFIGAVSGYLSMAVLTLFTFFTIDWLFPNALPESDQFPMLIWALILLVLNTVYAVIGGYIAVWLGDGRKGALIGLLVIITVMACVSFATNRGIQPLWYEISMVTLTLLGIYFGSVLRLRGNRSMFRS